MLHVPTLVAAAIVATILQAVAIAYVWYVQFRDRAVAELAVGTIATAVGAILALSRPALPPIVTHVIANMLIVGGQTFATFALGRFIGRRVPPTFVVGVPIMVGILIASFLYIEDRQDVRIAVYAAGIALATGTAAVLLLDVPPGPLRITHWPLGGLYLAQAALVSARGVWVLVEGPSESLFENNRMQELWFSQAVIFVNAAFIGLVLVITQRPRLELDRQASYDLLTGAMSRNAFERAAEAEWSRASRHDLPVSILILDLDRFKALNDTHGHEAGDAWLRLFAETVHPLLRLEDLFCRYGGEEFVVLLPQTEIEAASQAAERIRRAIEGLRLDHNGVEVTATVSIGVSAWTGVHPSLKSAIATADRALYRAKAAGRNRVRTTDGY